MFPQLIKEYPSLYGTRKVITVYTKARLLSLFWARTIQSKSTSFLRSILILSSRLRLVQRCLSSSGFLTKSRGLCFPFRNLSRFYCEEFLTSRRNPKLEFHLFSAIRDCLFNIFEASLHVCRPSSPPGIWWRTKPCWQGPKCDGAVQHISLL
jgi:hypothetical protein